MTPIFGAQSVDLQSLGIYWLILWTLTATAAWGAAVAVAICLRCHSAQARHRTWAWSMVLVLIAPLLVPLVPAPRWWQLPGRMSTGPAAAISADGSQEQRAGAVRSQFLDSLPLTPGPSPARGEGRNARDAFGEALTIREPHREVTTHSPDSPVLSDGIATANRTRSFAWQSWLITAWIGGGAISLLTFLVVSLRIKSLRRRSVGLTDGDEIVLAQEICRQLGIHRLPKLLVTPNVSVPLLAGVMRPAIVLPARYGRWSRERLRIVLAHELIHLKRRDLHWEIIARLALIPTWFHPLGWLAVRRLRVERELACDDAVLLFGAKPADYAEQLVEVAAELFANRLAAAPVVAMAGASPIERRVQSILDPRTWRAPLGRWRSFGLALSMVGVVFVIAALSPASGDQAASGKKSEKPEKLPAASPSVVENPPARATELRSDVQIAAELDRPAEVRFANLPLMDALVALSAVHRIPISLHGDSFLIAGGDLRKNVSIESPEITLREAIKKVVTAANVGAKSDLVIKIDHGALHAIAATGEPWQSNSVNLGEEKVVRGTIHTADGRPAANCQIIATLPSQRIALASDENGAFAVPVRGIMEQYLLEILVRSPDHSQLAVLPSRDVWNTDHTVLNGTLQKPRPISISVEDARGKPVADANVVITGPRRAFSGTGIEGFTDDAGKLTLHVPEKYQIGSIYAFKPGAGLDYRSYLAPLERDNSTEIPSKKPPQPRNNARLKFSGTRPLTIKFVDEDNRPIAGLVLSPWFFTKPGETEDLNQGPMQYAKTDVRGEATFDWIPIWQTKVLGINYVSDQFGGPNVYWIDPTKESNPPQVLRLSHLVEMSGMVRDAAGKPAANAIVEISGEGYARNERYGTDTKTDEKGMFRAKVSPNQLYLIAAHSIDRRQASAIRDGIAVYEKKPIRGIELVLQPATRVFGRATNSGKPLAWESVGVIGSARESAPRKLDFPQVPENSRRGPNAQLDPTVNDWKQTDADGRFEFYLGPGKYRIQGPADTYVPEFQVTGQKELNFDLHSNEIERDNAARAWRESQRKKDALLVAMEDHGYRLDEGQILRRIPPPFPAIRDDWCRADNPKLFENTRKKFGTDRRKEQEFEAKFLRNQVERFAWTHNHLSPQGSAGGGDMNIFDVLEWLAGIEPQWIEGAKAKLDTPIPGDWVVRDGASDEQIVDALNKILRNELSLHVQMKFRQVQRQVYVAGGTYRYQEQHGEVPAPLVARKARLGWQNCDVIDAYAKNLAKCEWRRSVRAVDCREFLDVLGSWINTPIVSDVKVPPERSIAVIFYDRSPATAATKIEDHDPALMLPNITAQTGLTFHKEIRTVRMLFVEETK